MVVINSTFEVHLPNLKQRKRRPPPDQGRRYSSIPPYLTVHDIDSDAMCLPSPPKLYYIFTITLYISFNQFHFQFLHLSKMAPSVESESENSEAPIKSRVTVVGSGNWGSVAAKLIASNTLKLPSFHGFNFKYQSRFRFVHRHFDFLICMILNLI